MNYKITYEPRFIYVITYIDEYDREFIEFTISREHALDEIFKKPLKIFFLLEHAKTYGFYDPNIPYYMVYSKCNFYPERMEMSFIPHQEWVPLGSPVSYLLSRSMERRKEKVYPKLFFHIFSEFGLVYILMCRVKRKSFLLGDYSYGEVEWKRQILVRRREQ